jgi:hypothetical protein
MEIRRIFVKRGDCKLWAVCYPEDKVKGKWVDVFRKLLDLWNNTAYLQQFFISNIQYLVDPFWQGISINDAINKVLDEAYAFEFELRAIETKSPGYESVSLSGIFENFHKDLHLLKKNNLYHKKGKPDFTHPMIRIYALEFEGCYIITGGVIKLTAQLEKDVSDNEIKKLELVQQYLQSEGVFNLQELNNQ